MSSMIPVNYSLDSMDFNSYDTLIVKLIQNTPDVDGLRSDSELVGSLNAETYYAHCRSVYDRLLTKYNNTHEDDARALFRSSGNENAFAIFHEVAELRDQFSNEEGCENTGVLDPFDNYSDSFTCWTELALAAEYGENAHFLKLMQSFFKRCEKTDIMFSTRRENIATFSKALQEVDDNGNSLLHIAVRGGSTKILDYLLWYSTKLTIKSGLNSDLNSTTSYTTKEGLLSRINKNGYTALHLALNLERIEIARKLIVHGADIFQKTINRSRNGDDEVSGRDMICERFPGLLGTIMDCSVIKGCRSRRENLPNASFGVDIVNNSHKYHVDLMPLLHSETRVGCTGKIVEMGYHFFNLFSSGSQHCAVILDHPVLQLLLHLKWEQLKHYIRLGFTWWRFLVYISFGLGLYWFYFVTCPRSSYFENASNSTNEDEIREENSGYYCEREKMSFWTIFLVLSAIGFTGVAVQDILMDIIRYWGRLVRARQKFYAVIKTVAKLMECIIVWLPVYFVVFSDYIGDWTHSYCVVVVFILGVELLSVIGNSNFQFGLDSSYIHVYWRIIIRFTTVLLTFSPLIATFTTMFNILYPDDQQFATLWRALFRIIMMLQGEINFEDKNYNENTEILNRHDQWLFWTGQTVFVVLGFVLSLLLLDILLGYTIDDIRHIKQKATYLRYRNEIKNIQKAEIQLKTLNLWNHLPYLDSHLFEYKLSPILDEVSKQEIDSKTTVNGRAMDTEMLQQILDGLRKLCDGEEI